MASCFSPLSISGVSNLFLKTPKLSIYTKSNRNLSVRADYSDSNRQGGGADFLAGFLVGGPVFGTLAYVFDPQIGRSLLNEDEYGFRRARKPIYYDDGLEVISQCPCSSTLTIIYHFIFLFPFPGKQRTKQTLNEKISQLNSAIDNVSSLLRDGNNSPKVHIETDPEVKATI
ncbi:hypothetical protein UlMin_033757 [Ulmus minor]